MLYISFALGERRREICTSMNYKQTVKELPYSERPYEKCESNGVKSLSDAELLAVILRTGSQHDNSIVLAQRIINLHPIYKNLVGLNYLSKKDLMQVHGIGNVKATQLICTAEISRRIVQASRIQLLSFHSPESIANYYMEEMRYLQREQIRLLLFDTKHHLLKSLIISEGTVNASITTPREIFMEALKYEAVHIILLHNHPSGDTTPSSEDINLTKRIYDAGILIGIHLSDHIILGNQEFTSLRQCGIIN